ncbi:hypothetical protein FRC03_010066 [Tulasnella sp. 419]|nr:hypothetical protein FRC03_010066 [Tulasnella sp. 419]
MLRVLVLHGYTQNAEILRKKLAAIRKACGKDVELTFVDGPIILAQADMEGFQSANTISSLLENAQTSPESTPRAWWRANADRTLYEGIETSVRSIRELMTRSEHRFDGIMGFSQGASMAALLCAILEKPHLYPSFLTDTNEIPHPPVSFGIFVAGFKPLDVNLSALFQEPLTTPTLHVLGSNDLIVMRQRSQTLIDVCSNPRIEVHDGGHFVPSKASWRTFFRDYITSYSENSTIHPSSVISPTPSVTPAPSELGTPMISRDGSPKPPDGPAISQL